MSYKEITFLLIIIFMIFGIGYEAGKYVTNREVGDTLDVLDANLKKIEALVKESGCLSQNENDNSPAIDDDEKVDL